MRRCRHGGGRNGDPATTTSMAGMLPCPKPPAREWCTHGLSFRFPALQSETQDVTKQAQGQERPRSAQSGGVILIRGRERQGGAWHASEREQGRGSKGIGEGGKGARRLVLPLACRRKTRPRGLVGPAPRQGPTPPPAPLENTPALAATPPWVSAVRSPAPGPSAPLSSAPPARTPYFLHLHLRLRLRLRRRRRRRLLVFRCAPPRGSPRTFSQPCRS